TFTGDGDARRASATARRRRGPARTGPPPRPARRRLRRPPGVRFRSPPRRRYRPEVAIGVYPGSFDPLTIAHLAVADAAFDTLGLDRLDLAISGTALGKEHLDDTSVQRRLDGIRDATADRPWLEVVAVREQLIVDIAEGYDVVVMGAD